MILAQVDEGLLEVLRVPMNPLAAIAALGDGVELMRSKVTLFSHANEHFY